VDLSLLADNTVSRLAMCYDEMQILEMMTKGWE